MKITLWVSWISSTPSCLWLQQQSFLFSFLIITFKLRMFLIYWLGLFSLIFLTSESHAKCGSSTFTRRCTSVHSVQVLLSQFEWQLPTISTPLKYSPLLIFGIKLFWKAVSQFVKFQWEKCYHAPEKWCRLTNLSMKVLNKKYIEL